MMHTTFKHFILFVLIWFHNFKYIVQYSELTQMKYITNYPRKNRKQQQLIY